MRNIFVQSESVSIILEKLLLFTLFFPYIPGIVRSTDTQPTFTLLIFCAFGFILMQRRTGNNLFKLTNGTIFVLLSLLYFAIFSSSANVLVSEEKVYPIRLFSFIQFVLAVLFGMYNKLELEEGYFKKTLLIYVVFTLIFFISRGLIEDFLIGSRDESTEVLLQTGRGAKTLSPEPSQFALQIFNILVIYLLWFSSKKHKISVSIFLPCMFCFLSSLSGYGFVLLLVLIVVRFPRASFIGFLGLLASSPYIIGYLEFIGANRRIFHLLIVLYNKGIVNLFQSDSSIGTRIGSFMAYIERAGDFFLIGDGFSLLKGGGFISLIASLGLVALLFFIFVVARILFLKDFSFLYKAVVIFWFIMNCISGSVAVPPIGFIIGLILTHKTIFKNDLFESSAEARVNH